MYEVQAMIMHSIRLQIERTTSLQTLIRRITMILTTIDRKKKIHTRQHKKPENYGEYQAG